MAQKNHLTKIIVQQSHPLHNKPIANSAIHSHHHSNHHPIHKYIPIHFRNKPTRNNKHHLAEYQSQILEDSSSWLQKRDISLSKGLKSQQRVQHSRQEPSQHHLTQRNKPLKYLTIDTSIPKLRESNSTRCQSPQASHSIVISKLHSFRILRLLGSGKFGEVHLVKDKRSGFVGALKIVNKRELLCGSEQQNEKAVKQMIRQIKVQSFLSHPNLIKLYDCFSDEDNIYLLLELACDGQLYLFLEKSKTFSEETTSIVVREIVEGLHYMHRYDVIHRDIKLENIVICHGMAKICDFGWSVHCPKQFRNTLCGTPLYLSPEILSGKLYTKKIDIWAIGALTHELFSSENPFRIKNKEDLSKIITEDFEIHKGSPELKSFLIFILKKDPSKRPDSSLLRTHSFLQKYKDLETSDELCLLGSMKR